MPSIPEAEFVPQRKASPRRGITHLSNVDETVLQIWNIMGRVWKIFRFILSRIFTFLSEGTSY